MTKLLGLLAALVVAAAAPSAAAPPPAAYDCRIINASDSNLTGQGVFDGAVAGFAITGDAQSVSVRCYVQINGVEAASTPLGTGTGAAATAGRVTYAMNEGDTVLLCIEVTWSAGFFSTCAETLLVDVSPQELADVLAQVAEVVNPVCGSAGLDGCSNGICVVNTGTCAGGTCVVNTGWCGRGCTVVVNTGTCGQTQVDPGGVWHPL